MRCAFWNCALIEVPYGMSPYWGNGFYMGGYGGWSAGMSETHYADARPRQDELSAERHRDDDLHLRSIGSVTGYNLQATDGFIGHVEGFLIEDTDWTIHFLAVDTKCRVPHDCAVI